MTSFIIEEHVSLAAIQFERAQCEVFSRRIRRKEKNNFSYTVRTDSIEQVNYSKCRKLTVSLFTLNFTVLNATSRTSAPH
jgi:hypothetical protein